MIKIGERIKMLCTLTGLTPTELEREIGASKGVLTKAIANNSDVQSKWLVAIAEKYPDWSIEWMLTGKGSSLRSEHINDNVYSAAYEKAKNEYQDKIDLVPELPIDAAAGFTDDIQNGITPSMCNMLPRIPGLPPYDLTISVRGDSMDPTFESGDRLAIRRCFDIIEWGAPHVIDTTEGVYIKRIREDDQNIICISDNTDYPEFNIPKTCIRGVYKVVALLRIC